MKSHCNYILIVSIVLALALVFAVQSLAGDIEAKLSDSNNTSSFQIKNSQDDVLFIVKSGGKAGMGTSNPEDGKMQVVGGSNNAIAASSTGANGIHAESSAGGGYAAGYFSASNNGTYGVWATSSNYDALYAYSSASAPHAAIRATASSGAYAGIFNGNVGINTTNPQAPLVVRYSSSNNAWAVPALTLDNPAGGSRTALSFRIDGTVMAYINTTDSEDIVIGRDGTFRISNYGNSRHDLTVTSAGDVGIGTTNPSYKLQVNGSVGAISFVQSSSRDYKEEIQKVDESTHPMMLAKIMSMDLTTYKYKKEYGGDDSRRLGFIAEDLPKEVLSKDGRGVDVYELLALTIGAMKAQQEENEVLKEKLEDIMARLKMLEE